VTRTGLGRGRRVLVTIGPPMIQLDIEICGAPSCERLAGDIMVVVKDG
jgi:hypothetical protein